MIRTFCVSSKVIINEFAGNNKSQGSGTKGSKDTKGTAKSSNNSSIKDPFKVVRKRQVTAPKSLKTKSLPTPVEDVPG